MQRLFFILAVLLYAISVHPTGSRAEPVLDQATRISIQSALNDRGIQVGRPDGKFGPATRRGIRMYQRRLGLRPTGFLTARQIETLLAGNREPEAKKRKNRFDILRRTDLEGLDYRHSGIDPALRGLKPRQCQAACAQDGRCRAFTYNRAAKWCWLKTGVGQRKRFAGAVSGIKKTAQVAGTVRQELGTPGNRRPTTVAEIREAAVPFGGDCRAELATIGSLQRSARVSLKSQTARVGEHLALNWQHQTTDEALPAYLMMAFDQPVRFKGRGFYPLMPNAQAAFGITWNQDKTRAVVPLYGAGAHPSGTVEVEPLLARDLNIEWSVIGYLRRCKHEAAGRSRTVTASVRPGRTPQIILHDEASLTDPLNVFRSRDGSRLLEEYPGRFRLLDARTGIQIIEREGTEPAFSPTGRFLTVRARDYVDILDAVDGKQLELARDERGWRLESDEIGWRKQDGVVINVANGGGLSEVFFALAPHLKFDRSQACRICSGLDSGYALTDLENNLVFSRDYHSYSDGRTIQNVRIFSLTNPDVLYKTNSKEFDVSDIGWIRKKGSSAPFSNGRLSITTFHPGNIEQSLVGTVFSHLSKFHVSQNNRGHLSVVTPISVSASQRQQSLAVIENSAAWRAVTQVQPNQDSQRIAQRLAELGLPMTLPREPAFTRQLSKEDGTAVASLEADKIISQIYQDSPKSIGTFIDRKNTGLCGPGGENGEALNRFDKVARFEAGNRLLWITHLRCSDGSAAFKYPTIMLFDSAHPDGRIKLFADLEDQMGTACSFIGACDLHFDLVAERYFVFWSKETRAVAVLDLKTWKTVFHKQELERGDLLERFGFSPATNHLTQINRDGSFFVYRMRDWKRIAEGRFVDDEVIVWTPQGHYDASPEGAHMVNLKYAGDISRYSFQQFGAKLHVPGLVTKLLNQEPLPPVDVGVPPKLAGAFIASNDNRILANLRTRSYSKVTRLNLYQDGILTDNFAPEPDGTFAVDAVRLPGTRWVSAVAIDGQGLASSPIGRDLGLAQSTSKMHVLAVGVDQYDDDRVVDLSFAATDARNFVAGIANMPRAKSAVGEKSLLIDADATGPAVLENARRIVAAAKPGETVVFFFAGHGVKGQQGRFYLGTPGVDAGNIENTALPWDDLAKVFAGSKARVLIFIDACHSGTAGTDFFATNDNAAAGLLGNIPSGLVIFAASKGREVSLEEPTLGGGVFTTAVVDVISKRRSLYDLNRNGAIEVSELYRGVKKKVSEETKGRQTPWLARNQMIGDFAMF